MDLERIHSIVATDCGSTTTKAILIERGEDGFRLRVRGEAPTTVEAPAEDVTQGVRNALAEVGELAGRPLLDGEGQLIKPDDGQKGIDLYLSTSSAGGGLQMMVAGVVAKMSAESAQRAAWGGGAVVMEVLAANDKRPSHQKIELIRQLRPDMVLLSGGVDGGVQKQVVELAQLFAAADPRPRLGHNYRLPLIFAGNKEVRPQIEEILASKVDLEIVDNLRPTLEEENLQPARLKIQNQFLEHVMAHAPGYPRLMEMVDAPIMPTPAAVGAIMERIAQERGINIMGVDIGGATTDVFSVFQGRFNRSVSANYGMSYSISNVLADAGPAAVKRWLALDVDEALMRNTIKNKMIRPTSIPYLPEDLEVEQALCREALRLSFAQHELLAGELQGVQRQSEIGAIFNQQRRRSLIDPLALDMLIGSGGVLSHAPKRWQTALMLLDSYQPWGITQLAVDSIFMMPQLGVLAQILPQAATQVFERDCLIELGTCVAPFFVPGRPGKWGQPLCRLRWAGREVELKVGEMMVIPLECGRQLEVELEPIRTVDVGRGAGVNGKALLRGGVVGVIVDGRGRNPFLWPAEGPQRLGSMRTWQRVMAGEVERG